MPKPPKPKGAPQRNNRALLIIVAIVAVVVVAVAAGGILLTRGGSSSSSSSGPTGDTNALVAGIHQDGTLLGRPGAAVTLKVYEDLQCPYCRQFTEDALPGIVEKYVRTGKVKLDWRGLGFIGPDSDKALRIALAAANQNKLWEVIEGFYARQGEENTGWVTDKLVDEVLASVPGLDAAQVKKDAKSDAITEKVKEIQADATAAGVSGTPSFFIQQGVNTPYQIQVVWTSADNFTAALDDALKG